MLVSVGGIFEEFGQVTACGGLAFAGVMLSPAPEPALGQIIDDAVNRNIGRVSFLPVIVTQFL